MKKKNSRPFEIIVLGGPVSGKGTQSGLLSATFDIPHISTGQILHAIKSDDSHPQSQLVAKYINSGSLVPDDLVNSLVLDRISQEDCRWGFLLDGYPRTMDQATVIDGATDLDYVFFINVPDKVIIDRISGRRVCSSGHAWHLKFAPPKISGICDICGESLFQRDDDREDLADERLKNFHNNMEPIIKFYQRAGILLEINGDQSIDRVFQEMVRYLVEDLRGQTQKLKNL